jgi:hypothetical protein
VEASVVVEVDTKQLDRERPDDSSSSVVDSASDLFVWFMGSLFENWERFVKDVDGEYVSMMNSGAMDTFFDIRAFIDDSKSSVRDFLEKFVQTQLFICFIVDKMMKLGADGEDKSNEELHGSLLDRRQITAQPATRTSPLPPSIAPSSRDIFDRILDRLQHQRKAKFDALASLYYFEDCLWVDMSSFWLEADVNQSHLHDGSALLPSPNGLQGKFGTPRHRGASAETTNDFLLQRCPHCDQFMFGDRHPAGGKRGSFKRSSFTGLLSGGSAAGLHKTMSGYVKKPARQSSFSSHSFDGSKRPSRRGSGLGASLLNPKNALAAGSFRQGGLGAAEVVGPQWRLCLVRICGEKLTVEPLSCCVPGFPTTADGNASDVDASSTPKGVLGQTRWRSFFSNSSDNGKRGDEKSTMDASNASLSMAGSSFLGNFLSFSAQGPNSGSMLSFNTDRRGSSSSTPATRRASMKELSYSSAGHGSSANRRDTREKTFLGATSGGSVGNGNGSDVDGSTCSVPERERELSIVPESPSEAGDRRSELSFGTAKDARSSSWDGPTSDTGFKLKGNLNLLRPSIASMCGCLNVELDASDTEFYSPDSTTTTNSSSGINTAGKAGFNDDAKSVSSRGRSSTAEMLQEMATQPPLGFGQQQGKLSGNGSVGSPQSSAAMSRNGGAGSMDAQDQMSLSSSVKIVEVFDKEPYTPKADDDFLSSGSVGSEKSINAHLSVNRGGDAVTLHPSMHRDSTESTPTTAAATATTTATMGKHWEILSNQSVCIPILGSGDDEDVIVVGDVERESGIFLDKAMPLPVKEQPKMGMEDGDIALLQQCLPFLIKDDLEPPPCHNKAPPPIAHGKHSSLPASLAPAASAGPTIADIAKARKLCRYLESGQQPIRGQTPVVLGSRGDFGKEDMPPLPLGARPFVFDLLCGAVPAPPVEPSPESESESDPLASKPRVLKIRFCADSARTQRFWVRLLASKITAIRKASYPSLPDPKSVAAEASPAIPAGGKRPKSFILDRMWNGPHPSTEDKKVLTFLPSFRPSFYGFL